MGRSVTRAPARDDAVAPAAGRAFARVRRELKANGGTDAAHGVRRARERHLLAAARAGDARATRELLDGVSATVYRFGRSFCRDPHDAEDVMQDVFAALTGSLGTFRGDASLASWAYVVAQRACARRRRRPEAVVGRVVSLDQPREAGGAGEIADERGDPARLAEASELREVLECAIRDLPGPQRDVLMLRDVEGVPAREVGRMLGMTERAVKSRLHRARLAVRGRVAAYRRGVLAPRPAGCPDTPALLSRFLEGEIRAADCAVIERHVTGCGWCRDACTALRDTLRACRRWGATPVPRAMRARLRRAVRRAVTGTAPRRRRSPRRPAQGKIPRSP
jgi:RNA polymerase sigma-70 factor (ECF subfamily)